MAFGRNFQSLLQANRQASVNKRVVSVVRGRHPFYPRAFHFIFGIRGEKDGNKKLARWMEENRKVSRTISEDRPIAKPSMIDEFIMDMNQRKHDNKVWTEKGIGSALDYEYEKEKMRKEFDEQFLLAQRPPRSRF